MDNYKKLTIIFTVSILSLALYTLPLRHISFFSYNLFAFNYSF